MVLPIVWMALTKNCVYNEYAQNKRCFVVMGGASTQTSFALAFPTVMALVKPIVEMSTPWKTPP
jgi:hypothetical protein